MRPGDVQFYALLDARHGLPDCKPYSVKSFLLGVEHTFAE